MFDFIVDILYWIFGGWMNPKNQNEQKGFNLGVFIGIILLAVFGGLGFLYLKNSGQ